MLPLASIQNCIVNMMSYELLKKTHQQNQQEVHW